MACTGKKRRRAGEIDIEMGREHSMAQEMEKLYVFVVMVVGKCVCAKSMEHRDQGALSLSVK